MVKNGLVNLSEVDLGLFIEQRETLNELIFELRAECPEHTRTTSKLEAEKRKRIEHLEGLQNLCDFIFDELVQTKGIKEDGNGDLRDQG